MTTPYTGISFNVNLSIVGNDPLVLAGLSVPARPVLTVNQNFANGLAAAPNTVDDHYEDPSHTLAASASVTYVLSNLVDTLPRTNVLIDVRLLAVVILSRTAGDHLTIGPGGTHGWTALIASGTIPIYSTFLFSVDKTDSLPVVSGTTDQLTISNAGSNPITFYMLIAGNTA